MGLFRPYQQGQTETEKVSDQPTEKGHNSKPDHQGSEPTASPQAEAEQVQITRRRGPKPKSGPTLSRAEAEAARMERLHPNLSRKELRQQDREAKRQARITNLDNLEKRPERQLIRDYVDARRTFSEFIMPIFLVFIVTWFVIIMIFPGAVRIVNAMTVLMLIVMVLWLVDAMRLWRPVRKQLVERYPDVSRRGLLSYLNNRAMTPRRWRRPTPRIQPASRKNKEKD